MITKTNIIVFLCFLVLAGQIVDSVSFAAFQLYFAPYTDASELNPLVNAIMSIGGPALVVAVKLFMGYQIWKSALKLDTVKRKIPLTLMAITLPIAAISGWIGFAFNSYAIYVVSGG